MYVLYIEYIRISIQYAYFFTIDLYISNAKNCKRLRFSDFGTVHSDRSAEVLLQTNTLVPDLAFSLILSTLSRTVCTLL
jgi:hypothetical protein